MIAKIVPACSCVTSRKFGGNTRGGFFAPLLAVGTGFEVGSDERRRAVAHDTMFDLPNLEEVVVSKQVVEGTAPPQPHRQPGQPRHPSPHSVPILAAIHNRANAA